MASSRTTQDFNFDWTFTRGDPAEAQSPDFDDSGWRRVRLPHDWSVELSFTQEEAGGSTAFLPGGIGWYRKTFKSPAGAATWIEFDGVYSNSEVWINGHCLGKRPYGYVPFSYDLTPHLRDEGLDNVIAVRVDRSAYIDCRWYPGSGIYRNVRLVTVGGIHIPQYGVAITTPVATAERAEVLVKTDIANAGDDEAILTVSTELFRGDGCEGAAKSVISVLGGGQTGARQWFTIAEPDLWDTESPSLYTAVTTLSAVGEPIDAVTTTFGIRDIRFDAETGFYLNGVNTPLKGVCLHHDGGCVGAAVPIGVWERRLETLKAAGCNAVRTAHNPPAAEFLDLCDRMGFLVQDEAFDEWTNPKDKRHNYNQIAEEEITKGYTQHFPEWAERDIKAMVFRDRNHPCIVMWSLGNEIEWTYPRYQAAAGYWDEGLDRMDYYYDQPPLTPEEIKARWDASEPGEVEMATIACDLAGWVREVDVTRPVTANLVIPSVGHLSGLTDPLDIVGYSYRQVMYDYGHELYPEKMIFGCENWCQWHEWKPALERDFVPGIFLWTGINYLGESRNWPTKASGSGLLDLAGFKQPRYHMFRTLWNDEPYVYAATCRDDADALYDVLDDGRIVSKRRDEKWMPMWGWQPVNEHWDYAEGDEVFVEVYTNCPEAELIVNGTSVGTKALADFDDHIIKWRVPYVAGEVAVMGRGDGGEASAKLVTAGAPAAVRLTVDRETLRPDTYDVAHVVAQVVDAAGVPVRTEEREIVFSVEGDCRILGVDNGATDSVQDYQSDRCLTRHGRCLLIVQAGTEHGQIVVSASAEGVTGEQVTLTLTTMTESKDTEDLLTTRAWEVEESPVDLGYYHVPDWIKLPEGWVLGQVAGVEADSAGNLYLFHRGDEAPPLICFDADGKVLFSWDHIEFGRPHMVLCDADDNVWLIDDGGHVIYKLSREGEVLFTLGVKGVSGEDGTRFDQPTDLAFGADGDMFVSDGYGNKRVARFDAAGAFITQWGSEGTGPGQFALPHAIATDRRGRVFVADRENWRVQVFGPGGELLTMWTHIGRPSDLKYVASEDAFYICDAPNNRVTKVDAEGRILGFFTEPGSGIHDITVAPSGDVYVGLLSGGVSKWSKRKGESDA